MKASNSLLPSGARLIAATQRLRDEVAKLTFAAPVSHVYNPLDYAWPAHEAYLRLYGGGRKRVLFLGMNPGPFGMAQTGIPFGAVAAVRDWLGITAAVGKPRLEHPKRPVNGFDCPRSEVSGQRLWGLAYTDINSENRLVQKTFAEPLRDLLLPRLMSGEIAV